MTLFFFYISKKLPSTFWTKCSKQNRRKTEKQKKKVIKRKRRKETELENETEMENETETEDEIEKRKRKQNTCLVVVKSFNTVNKVCACFYSMFSGMISILYSFLLSLVTVTIFFSLPSL